MSISERWMWFKLGWKERINSFALSRYLADARPQWLWAEMYLRTRRAEGDYPKDTEIPF